MGNNTTKQKVEVEVCLPAGPCTVDAVHLSYTRATCCGGRRRRLARFTLPRQGWVSMGGMQVCMVKGGLRVPLEALRQEDGSTAVRVRCTWRGSPLCTTCLPLARLLALLGESVEGSLAFLLLDLKVDENGHACSSLWCNGWRCGGGGEAGEHDGRGASPPGDVPGPAVPLDAPGEEQYGPEEEHATEQRDEALQGQASPARSGHCSRDAASDGGPDADLGTPGLSVLCGTVPEIDLGTPGLSALCGTVPQTDLGTPGLSALFGTVPEIDLGTPGLSVLCGTVPQIDLGTPGLSAPYGTVPYIGLGTAGSSAQARDTVAELVVGSHASSTRAHDPAPESGLGSAAVEARRRSTWVDALLDGAAVLSAAVSCVLVYREFW